MTWFFVFEFTLTFIIIGVVSIVVHEWAHQKWFEQQGRRVRIRLVKGQLVVGRPKDYEGLSRRQLRSVYMAGIYCGLVPIIIGAMIWHWVAFLILLPYTAWSWSDIQQWWRYR